jgi:glutamate-1-semialdehyde aminotransferase
MSYMGIGSCILGYSDVDVNRAVTAAIHKGSMTTLNAPEEVELAELLLKIHPWAHMVRYCRTGGEAMSVAVRIGRAAAGKDIVLFCGYHGWHDWYLSANLASDRALDGHLLPGLGPNGVPRHLRGSSFPFQYNDTEGFLRLVKEHTQNLGVIVIESIRNHSPQKEFIQAIQKIVRKTGCTLIVDEITAGFRLNFGGAHLLFGIEPDIAVFAKGISNGFPMAAVVGKRRVMQAAQDTFISSTYWTDRIGPVAALAALRKMKTLNVPKHLQRVGKAVQEGWSKAATKYGLAITVDGIYPLGYFSFSHSEPLVLKTLFTQEMLKRGFLATTAFYASFAHTGRHVSQYLAAVDRTFAYIADAIASGDPCEYLKTQVCHSGFKRLT